MAKTIKELAEKIIKDKEDEIVSVYDRYAGVIDGANAVLEAIEEELPKSDKQLNDYGKALLWRINKRIKELKGE